MTYVYMSDDASGFVRFSKDGSELIYGEICGIQRLSALLSLLPERSEIAFRTDNEKHLATMARLTEKREVICRNHTVIEGLDVPNAVRECLHPKPCEPVFHWTKTLLLICFVLGGMLCGMITALFLGTSDFFNSRQEQVEQALVNMKSVQGNASRTIDATALFNEISYIYQPDVINLFEVDDDAFKCIFFTSVSGMKNKALANASNTSLIESDALTYDAELKFMYTLTGILNQRE